MTVLLIWVLKSETNSYYLPVTTTSSTSGKWWKPGLKDHIFPNYGFCLDQNAFKKTN